MARDENQAFKAIVEAKDLRAWSLKQVRIGVNVQDLHSFDLPLSCLCFTLDLDLAAIDGPCLPSGDILGLRGRAWLGLGYSGLF